MAAWSSAGSCGLRRKSYMLLGALLVPFMDFNTAAPWFKSMMVEIGQVAADAYPVGPSS